MTHWWNSIESFEENIGYFDNFDFSCFLRTSYVVNINKFNVKNISFGIYSNKCEYRILYTNGLNVPALTDNVFSVEDVYYGVMTRFLTEERNFTIKNNIK